MDKYFVIGHPVKHSLSPEIHKMFAAQFDIEMSYETRDFEPGGFIEGMAVLRREDHPKGANVTHPFKMDAYQYCDEVTPRARKCEAVNTLIFDGLKSQSVTLQHRGRPVAEVNFAGFDNLLLWTKIGAPFLCIEPWTGLPDYVDSTKEIEKKDGILTLKKGETFSLPHTIRFFR